MVPRWLGSYMSANVAAPREITALDLARMSTDIRAAPMSKSSPNSLNAPHPDENADRLRQGSNYAPNHAQCGGEQVDPLVPGASENLSSRTL